MKKILLAVVVMIFTVISGSGVAYADYKGSWVEKQDLNALENERTDVYALDSYKSSAYSDDPAIVAKSNEIVAGITSDYEKVKAIYQWVCDNMEYTSTRPTNRKGIEAFLYGKCEEFAKTTMYLAQAAGFPAKVIGGAFLDGCHAWNEIYVDGRWVFVDSTNYEFDVPMYAWSQSYTGFGYSMDKQDKEAWDGTLYFYDMDNDKMVKEVKNFPLNGLVTSTYGFDINSLYFDPSYTEPFTLNTLKVNSQNCSIFVKSVTKYKVTFNFNSGTTVKAVTIASNSTITKPENPTRKGYKFVNWFKDPKCKTVWNFAKDKVTKNTILYAGWKKL